MKSIEEQIIDILDNARQEIADNLQQAGITTTGKTANSLRVVSGDGHIKLIQDRSEGGAPLATTEIGRRAGAVPSDFTAIIEQWSRDKHIPFDTDKERRAFAGAVAWGKIRRRGYGRPSPSDFGSSQAVIYTPVVHDTLDKLRKTIVDGIRAEVVASIKTNKSSF